MGPGSALDPADSGQHGFAYRFEWGLDGVQALAPSCQVLVIVDVLRFTSAVSVAVDRNATVYPYRWNDASAADFALDHGAVLAGRREDGPVSLSPVDLATLAGGTRVVLPSPNGSTLSGVAAELGVPWLLAGSLRNAIATARRARLLADGGAIGVIAAGEQWPTGRFRPCVEDLLGAGAILASLDPSASISHPGCSPEAAAARSAFLDSRPMIDRVIAATTSGRELLRRGWADDVAACGRMDVSSDAAQWCDGAFVNERQASIDRPGGAGQPGW